MVANPLPPAPLNIRPRSIRFRQICLDIILNRPLKGTAESNFRLTDFLRRRLLAAHGCVADIFAGAKMHGRAARRGGQKEVPDEFSTVRH